MIKLGLVGHPIKHSLSPALHEGFMAEHGVRGSYTLLECANLSRSEFRALFFEDRFHGVNITIPYKTVALTWVDEIDPYAEAIGAINTVVIENGRLVGYNTDVDGIRKSLNLLGTPQPALVFGTGGASKAAAFVLKQMGISHKIIGRRTEPNYNTLTAREATHYKWWINCTPVGGPKFPGDYLPLPMAILTKEFAIFDMNYEPKCTPLMLKGKELGATTLGGTIMLTEQAKKAWQLFHAAYYKTL